MSYTELEHGYQDLRSTSRPIFYVGDINTVQPALGDPGGSSLYRSIKRGELSDGCGNEDGCMGGSDVEGEGKQVLVGVCAMAKKSQSKPMKEILTRLEEFEYIKILVFPEEVILKEPVEDWPLVDCLISFHSKGFPLDKAIHYANLRNPFIINNLPMQYDIQDRRRVYAILDSEGIEIPRYAVLDRDSADPKHHELVESEDHVEVNGVTFNKPFVEKPVSAEDHNIYIYYPTSAGGGSQRLFRKIGSRSSVYSPESRVRKTGSYIYEDFMPTDGTDVKVYTVGPDYAHAEARKSPALDGKVERDSEGKEIRYPVILSNAEKLISRKVCLAFKQTVCGFDLLRANGKSFVCDVNGFSFVKNSNKYYDDCAKILGNMILRELAPTLHIPWSVPFQLDDPPIVPTTFGKMMELRCVVAVIRHGDRTPKQKMKVEVRHPKFFEIFAKYDGYKHGHVKLKRPKQLQEILDTARSLLTEIQHRAAGPELEEKQGKLEQLKSVLEMYGHFSGINRKVQMKYQPRGRPRGSSSDDGNSHNRLGEPSLVLILKWGGELTPAGRIQAEELGRIFRCMYPGGQGRHLSEEDSEMLPSHGEYAGAQGLGLLRLHSTFRHDLKIYASDEGRVQMTAAAFAKGLLALEGELTPILVQMVKSANTNGLLDNDCDSSKYQNMVKTRLHELLQQDREFTREDREQINPGNALSINDALDFVKNPVKCCQHVQALIQKLMDIVRIKKDDPKTKDAILYHGETWELMGRRWGKIEKDFCTKNKRFDISKIPDIYDCIKYDLQHNNHTLQFDHAEELYIYAKYLADIVIPQEYGLTVQEKLTIGQGICTPLLKKIRADLQRNIEESGEETVNRLNPRYSHGVSSPGRHVRTRLYFTSESHVHSLLTVLRYGGLLDVVKDEQWRRAMEYVSMVSELNYMSQIVVMLYEDPTKDPSSEERFHVELHFSPGVNCCVQKNLPPGPGFRPHSRNESSHNLETNSQCSTRIDEEDAELGGLDDGTISPQQQSDSSPAPIEIEETADSTLDSPTTSRAIDMMDLDPNMMDEPYDSGFLQASAPIPISARTVAGHEAARLGSQLAASQRQRREREAISTCEPRARSYDHQRQEKVEKTVEKLQYQSLDAVNKEDSQASRCCDRCDRCDVDDLFFKRVESLVKNPSGCLGASASSSFSSSSPDLPSRLTERGTVEKRCNDNNPHERVTSSQKPRRKPEVHFEEPGPLPQEPAFGDKNDFWDFGEIQLLEKSSVHETIDNSDKKQRFGNDETTLTSRKEPRSEEVNPRVLKTRIVITNDEIDVKDNFSSETVPRIERDEIHETPCVKIYSSARNPSMTRTPSCLGIPVSLPHSVSSPELPVPLIETILESSSALVTLHNTSLASSHAYTPSSSDKVDRCDKKSSTLRVSIPVALQTSETKRYGRSKSALTLSIGNEPRGELGGQRIQKVTTVLPSSTTCERFPIEISTCQPSHCKIIESSNDNDRDDMDLCRIKLEKSSGETKEKTLRSGWKIDSCSTSCKTPTIVPGADALHEQEPNLNNCQSKPLYQYSTSLPALQSYERRESVGVPVNEVTRVLTHSKQFNPRRTSLTVPINQELDVVRTRQDYLRRQDLRFFERSRSLSPCLERCQCYNCNVSALIQQSINLPPAERSNFQNYFLRSLSHKFINCCCYKLSLEGARASRRVSRSASPNCTGSSESVGTEVYDLPFTGSLPCLDFRHCSKYGFKRRSSREPCIYGSRRIFMDGSVKLHRRLSSPRNLGSSLNDSYHHCQYREHDSLDHSHPIYHNEFAGNDNIDHSAVLEVPKTTNTPCASHIVPGANDTKVLSIRSLPRQSSCPAVVVDSSLAYPSESLLLVDCDCYNCILVKESDIGSSIRSRNRFQNYQSSPCPYSTGFLIPDRKSVFSQARKFSCPEIIAEASSASEPMQFQCSPETEGICSERRSVKRSKFLSCREVADLTEEGNGNYEDIRNDRMSELLRHRNVGVMVPRQVSCPEISAFSADSDSHLLLHRFDRKGSSQLLYDEECDQCRLQSLKPSLLENCWYQCTANCCRRNFGTRCKNPTVPWCSCLCLNDYKNDCKGTDITTFHSHRTVESNGKPVDYLETDNTNCKIRRHKTSAISTISSSSHPRLQTQRSFSSPDTRPSIIQQPDPTCTARRHRHSISGQMSYFKLLGYNVSKKLTGSTNSLFSTAVISGSSSAPNLKDMVPPHASAVAAIEGFGGVPPIRPLETLHNALSLRQLDFFLDMMTNASLFRTPASSPPKFPSPGGSIHGGTVIPNLSIGNINREYHSSDLEAVRYITPTPMHYKPGTDGDGNDNRNQLSPTSPNSAGWSSEPQSFLSSEPSSPAPTSAGDCSMSMSLVSNDGTQPFVGSSKVSTTPRLDLDFNDFCRSLDQEMHGDSRGSISYTDYYSNEDGLIRKNGADLANLRQRATQDEMSQESIVDEDEEHTLTLRETEEHRKQDVKFIFDQNKECSPSLVKPSSSYKKIGRFRVESMEIVDEDVRIKEAAAAAAAKTVAKTHFSGSNLSLDKVKSTNVRDKSASVASFANDPKDVKKSRGTGFATPQNRSRPRGRTIARSQSVSTPQYTRPMSGDNTGSFSTMSCEDLENWKLTAASPPATPVTSPADVVQEEPILTLASSLKGPSNITVGFNVQDDKKE